MVLDLTMRILALLLGILSLLAGFYMVYMGVMG
jgi:hypothetical protein